MVDGGWLRFQRDFPRSSDSSWYPTSWRLDYLLFERFVHVNRKYYLILTLFYGSHGCQKSRSRNLKGMNPTAILRPFQYSIAKPEANPPKLLRHRIGWRIWSISDCLVISHLILFFLHQFRYTPQSMDGHLGS